ncbi:MAG TPA: metallophosphoesterase [Thermoanaerobaculia bacterium]|nr:metallophosphoesterase [Thermoanaerobaculia bacterium]
MPVRPWRLAVAILVLLSPLGAWAAPAPIPPTLATPSAGGTFVALSDLHFNPFYDPALMPRLMAAEAGGWRAIFESSTVTGVSGYGADTNYPLLRSALAAAQGSAPHPDFVLISGDFLGHDFHDLFAKSAPDAGDAAYLRFVVKTMEFVAGEIRAAFPAAPVLPALGNNDSDCGDYALRPGGRFLAAVEKVWKPLVGERAGSFAETFPAGGWYSVAHPTVPRLRLVVLNTVFFSPKFNLCGTPGNPADPRDPGRRQLAWLHRTLLAAARRGEKVWMLYHIPPGIDAYATLHAADGCASPPVPMWKEAYLSRFAGELARFPGRVEAAFAGHTHMDEIRLPASGGFIHVTPAVSPLFGNNPGFQVFAYDRRSGALGDLHTQFLDLTASGDGPPKWAEEYGFEAAYGLIGYNRCTLEQVELAVGKNSSPRDTYMKLYPVSSPASAADTAQWKGYWCGIANFTAKDFAACYCGG